MGQRQVPLKVPRPPVGNQFPVFTAIINITLTKKSGDSNECTSMETRHEIVLVKCACTERHSAHK
jgi:hypothetical protein